MILRWNFRGSPPHGGRFFPALLFGLAWTFSGLSARAQVEGQPSENLPAGQLKLHFDAPTLSPTVQVALADLLVHLHERLSAEEFGLKLPPLASEWFRLRVPARDTDPPFPGYAYTAGTSAITAYAAADLAFLDGDGGLYDPVFQVLDRAAELGWCARIQLPWLVPAALREAVDRLYAQRLLEELEADGKAAEKAEGAFWPGRARARAGSLENLPASHPLVQDRDRFLALLQQFEESKGRAELPKALNYCNDTGMSGEKTKEKLLELLAPLLPAGTASPFPAVDYATREPWNGLEMLRIRGLQGELGTGGYKLKLGYGEQRTTPREFVSVRQGAPTLIHHVPLVGSWSLTDLELCARRSVKSTPTPQPDPALRKLFWVVVLDRDFHELYRWPFIQAQIPVDAADWIRLTFPPAPQLPKDFYFVALEFEDPGEGADVEICVRPWKPSLTAPGPEAWTEHCFWSVPSRALKSLDRPFDFAIQVEIQGYGTPRGVHPNNALIELQKAAQQNVAPKNGTRKK